MKLKIILGTLLIALMSVMAMAQSRGTELKVGESLKSGKTITNTTNRKCYQLWVVHNRLMLTSDGSKPIWQNYIKNGDLAEVKITERGLKFLDSNGKLLSELRLVKSCTKLVLDADGEARFYNANGEVVGKLTDFK